MSRFLITWGAILLAGAALIACTPETADPIRAYHTPIRSSIELAAELTALCQSAMAPSTSATSRPILVEFSAAWCSDCQRLGEMKQAKVLADELSEWPNTTVNVGRFDQHREILDAMKIESIAHWAILQPTNCADPIDRWTRIADRTLEVSSGEARKLTPADLAGWLRTFRTS